MKRVIALVITVGLLCSLTPALAFYVPKHIDEFDGLPSMPRLSDFAAMRTWQEEEIVTIYLDKEVENLRANWLEYNNEHEEDLEVSESGDVWTARLDTTGHKYQVGAHWTNAYAYETYVENDGKSNEKRYQTMLRATDEAEGKAVGDTMAQRETMKQVNTNTRMSSGTALDKNDSAVNEVKGLLYNDQPAKFEKHEVAFTYNPSDVRSSNAQIEANIEALKQQARQEAEVATDELGKSHYDQYGSRADLQNYYCVKVEEPFYAVVKTLDDGKFCILSRYKYDTKMDTILQDYKTRGLSTSEYKLYRVNCYVTAWHPTYAASDGTSDGRYTVAYLSDQIIDGQTWTVAYGRNGKIQWFYVTLYDTELFGQDMGTAKIQFEPCNSGWFIREVTEMYEDGSYISAFYNRTGNGKLSYYKASEFFPTGSSSFGSNQHSSDRDPLEDPYDPLGDYDPLEDPYDPFGPQEPSNDDEFPDLDDDSPETGNDSGDVVYYGFEDPENDEYVLHLASCPLVQYRDMNDDRWAAYTEGSFDRDMYEMCDMCNP